MIAVIIRANGTIQKSFRKYMNNITGKHEINELKKISHTGRCIQAANSTNVIEFNAVKNILVYQHKL